MTETRVLSLRERSRRAVQAELVDVASGLFVERGYDETTVESIAMAAGMSKRSFFRYFASKDDLVMGKYDLYGEQLAIRLRDRPEAEPLWASLRRMFDDALVSVSAPTSAALMDELERVIAATPTLQAAYLHRLRRIQVDIEEIVRSRAEAAGSPYGEADPTPAAVVGAAFACLDAARAAAPISGEPWAALLDAGMRSVGEIASVPAEASSRSEVLL